jgi:hypothetical protein
MIAKNKDEGMLMSDMLQLVGRLTGALKFEA